MLVVGHEQPGAALVYNGHFKYPCKLKLEVVAAIQAGRKDGLR